MSMLPGLSHWTAEGDAADLHDITLGALLRQQSGRFTQRRAFVFDEGIGRSAVIWTYAELDEKVDDLAKALIAAGVAHGDRVAVMAPNCPEWLLLEYALARIGAV